MAQNTTSYHKPVTEKFTMPKKVTRTSFANYTDLNQFLDDAILSVESDRETHGVRSMKLIINELNRLPKKQAILATAHLIQILEMKSNDFIRFLELNAGII